MSRAGLLEDLYSQRDALILLHKFDPDNGWQQVVGADFQTLIQYGRFTMLTDLIEGYES